jgi:aquaporin Z
LAGFGGSAGLAANGYGVQSPGGYSLHAAMVLEVVMTVMFLFIILGALIYRYVGCKKE